MHRLLLAALGCAALCACGTFGPNGGTGGGGGTATGGGSGGAGGGTAGGAGGGTGGTGGAGGGSGGGAGGGGAAPLTWYKDVLPVAQTRCMACHVSGGIAPFSMETLAEVQNNAGPMAAAVTARRMPPWMPAPGCGDFANERRLSQSEIDLFNDWFQAGATAGNPADAPPPLQGPPALARVDLTLKAQAAYTPAPPNGRADDYHCFLLDPALSATQDIIGFEVSPQVRAEVHHVILYQVDKAAAETKDSSEAGEGWTCFGSSGVSGNPTMIGGWVPGTGVVNFPTGIGVELTAGKAIAMQIHYNVSNGVQLPDQTEVKFMFATAPVTKGAFVPLLDNSFSIPPNTLDFTPPTQPKRFPSVGVKLWGVLPHMHTRGKRLKVDYTPTGGSTQCLVDVPQWDFHWQQLYFYKNPVQLGASLGGIGLTCTWDNPTAKTVTWGEGTDDEMCLNYAFLTP